jgi:hypothetical protein
LEVSGVQLLVTAVQVLARTFAKNMEQKVEILMDKPLAAPESGWRKQFHYSI